MNTVACVDISCTLLCDRFRERHNPITQKRCIFIGLLRYWSHNFSFLLSPAVIRVLVLFRQGPLEINLLAEWSAPHRPPLPRAAPLGPRTWNAQTCGPKLSQPEGANNGSVSSITFTGHLQGFFLPRHTIPAVSTTSTKTHNHCLPLRSVESFMRGIEDGGARR